MIDGVQRVVQLSMYNELYNVQCTQCTTVKYDTF